MIIAYSFYTANIHDISSDELRVIEFYNNRPKGKLSSSINQTT